MIPRRRQKLHPYRVFFWTFSAFVALTATLHRCPVTIDAKDPALGGRWHSAEAKSDFLVVLSERVIAESALARAPDRSFVWLDLLRQEVGPVASTDIADLDGDRLARARVVVFTRSATLDERAELLVDMLEEFAVAGGVVALELPEGPLRTRFAADGAGGWRRADAITAAEGVPNEVVEDLGGVPLLTRFRGSTRPLAEAETLLAMDGAPVIYARTTGLGGIVVFDFELSLLLSRLQQGTPGPDFKVTARRHGEPRRTYDVASTPALIGSTVPYADLLERYVAHVALGHHGALFSLWPFPDAKRGALITSHDSRTPEGRPLWMSIHERSHGARSTTFVGPPEDPSAAESEIADPELAGHAAILWVLDPADAGVYRRFGAFGAYPIRQSLTLVGQMEELESALGDEADIRGGRVWDSRWTPGFTDAYRIMEAAELRYSVTYGPPPHVPPGYLFGTCQPFTPLDTNGLPFRLQEVPVCFDNPTTTDAIQLFQEALQEAAKSAWAVHLLTSSDRFRHRPDLPAFEVWREALRFAERSDMWIGGAGEFVNFRRRRSSAGLHVVSRQVTAMTGDGEPRAVEYIVEAETNGRGLVLMVPGTMGAMTFDQATRGGVEARQYEVAGQVESAVAQHLGREVRLIPLNPGFTTVGIRYRR